MAAEARSEGLESASGRRVAKNTLTYLLGQVVSWGIKLISISIVPRRLGPAAMGQLTIAAALVMPVATLAMINIETYITTEVGRERARAQDLLRATIGMRLALAPAFVLISAVTLAVAGVSQVVWLLGAAVIVQMCFAMVMQPLRAALVGSEQARRVAAVDLTTNAAWLVAIPFLAFGPISVALAGVATTGLACLAGAYWMSRSVLLRPTFSFAEWKRLAICGLPFLGNYMLLQVYSSSTVLILRRFGGEAVVGVFNQGQTILTAFLFVPTALGTALLPGLSRLADRDTLAFRALQGRVLALLVALGLPVACMAFVLAAPVCRILYGTRPGFEGVPTVLQVGAFGVIPVYITSVLYQFLVAQRKQAVWSIFLTGTVLVNVLGCFVLIPLCARYLNTGAAGGQAAWLLAETVTVPFALVLLRSNPFNRETLGRIARSIPAAALMFAAMWYTRSLFIAIPAALGFVVFAVAAWLFRALGAEEQNRLVSLVRGRLARG